MILTSINTSQADALLAKQILVAQNVNGPAPARNWIRANGGLGFDGAPSSD